MAFTYTSDLTVDSDFVRFHTGDTDSDSSFLSDAIITSLLAVEASKEDAVIAALKYILTQLAKPNFRSDALQVDYKTAYKSYEALLERKYKELGVAKYTASVTHAYRVDSLADEEPYT